LREFKVGFVVLLALVALAAGIFMVGDRSNLFGRKSHYYIRFETAAGLAAGNPVQLNGVNVGSVTSIDLPEEADEPLLTVRVAIDRRYADRVRTDSEARIKTLGLLGDKYVQLTAGSHGLPTIPSGGEIKAAEATDVDQLISSGENAVDNFVAISVSLRNILARMESGEGILGQLTSDTEAGAVTRDKLASILASVESLAQRAERGEGSLGRLLTDDTLVRHIEASLARLDTQLASLETGEGLLPLLVNDAAAKESFTEALANLNRASGELADLAHDLREGQGLLPRLISDEEFGARLSGDLERLLANLSKISERLEAGDGTAGQLINDPQISDAMNDILVGINESKLLRWLIRNRQKKGIEKRYAEAVADPTTQPEKP